MPLVETCELKPVTVTPKLTEDLSGSSQVEEINRWKRQSDYAMTSYHPLTVTGHCANGCVRSAGREPVPAGRKAALVGLGPPGQQAEVPAFLGLSEHFRTAGGMPSESTEGGIVMIAEAQRARARRVRGDGDAARVSAARAAASDAGLSELVINAQKDVRLFSIDVEDGRLEDVLAGALLDLGTLMTVTGRIALPANAVAGPGTPNAREAGFGLALSQAAYTLARRAAAEVLSTGTYNTLASASPDGWQGQEEKAS